MTGRGPLSQRVAVLLVGAASVGLACVLTLAAGSGRANSGAAPADVTPTLAPSTAATPTGTGGKVGTGGTGGTRGAGRQVFLRDCAWCHGTGGTGTDNGPSLVGVGEAAADFYLQTGRMPLAAPDADVKGGKPAYPRRTIDALVKYVGSLGAGPAVPTLTRGDPALGRTLFLENCAACHSASGTGTIVTGGQQAPDLWATPDQQVAEAIRLGPGPMPPFATKQLSDEDVSNIVSYVHRLGQPQRIGGAGLDQYGPIIEGAAALFLLLPAVVLVTRALGKRAPTRKEEQ